MPDDPKEQLPLDNIGPGAANVQPVNIEDEMRRSYLDYSMSVIIGRALPDIRDGLKPVHRRILYAMHDMGVLHNRKYMKCAGVVGECLKKYHPHGDSAVYDAIGASGAAVEFALSAHRRAGQLWFGGWRSAGGLPLHRIAHDRDRRRVAGRHRQGHGRLRRQLRRHHGRADGVADAHSEPHHQWLGRYRGRHGDQNSAAQSDRDRRRRYHAGEQSPRHAGRHHEVRAGAGLSYRRLHSRAQRHYGGVSHRARPLRDARQGGDRAPDQRQGSHRRHRNSLPGQQVDPGQAHRRAGEQQGHRRNQRRARRERSRWHAYRRRTEARHGSAGGAESALQAHRHAGAAST